MALTGEADGGEEADGEQLSLSALRAFAKDEILSRASAQA